MKTGSRLEFSSSKSTIGQSWSFWIFFFEACGCMPTTYDKYEICPTSAQREHLKGIINPKFCYLYKNLPWNCISPSKHGLYLFGDSTWKKNNNKTLQLAGGHILLTTHPKTKLYVRYQFTRGVMLMLITPLNTIWFQGSSLSKPYQNYIHLKLVMHAKLKSLKLYNVETLLSM